jgi:uncharacterized NAD(P)/FAD-binding protein YdhS
MRVAIVGAGYCGSLVAGHLLRQKRVVEIDLIDTRLPGRGLAYSTVWNDHLLNVPAGRMSAFVAEPNHFLEWVKANGHPQAQPESFIPRNTFGRYIQEVLQSAVRDAPVRHRMRYHAAKTVRVMHGPEGARLSLSSGDHILADRVILATGNPAPRPVETRSDHYFHSPWENGAVTGLRPQSTVLLLGSGLTAVDAFLALRAQGHAGPVICVSRRGKASHVHTLYRVLPEPFVPRGIDSARHLLRAIRRRVLEAQAQGYDWRAVVDSLRPITNELWCGFDPAEKARVLRHLKTWWDIHRHRMAPEIGVTLEQAIRKKSLRFVAGRLRQVQPDEEGLQVQLQLRGGESLSMKVERLISCTGSELNCWKSEDPFLRSLLESGRATPGEVGLGLRTDRTGALIDAQGTASTWLFAIGTPRFGDLFETTAIPELRIQAEALANHLVETPYEPVEPPMEAYMAAGI